MAQQLKWVIILLQNCSEGLALANLYPGKHQIYVTGTHMGDSD